jgi:4-aminobutyrate aminotransferase
MRHLLAVEPARDEAERVMYACLSRGLSFKVAQGNVLVLSPPLVIDEADLARALDIVDAAIGDVEATLTPAPLPQAGAA